MFMLYVLAAANAAVPSSGADWLVIPFLILMFPVALLGLLFGFTNDLVPLMLVPLNSIFWGVVAAYLFVKPQRKE